MKKVHICLVTLAAVLALLLAQPARADSLSVTIGPGSGCTTGCFGMTFSLSFSQNLGVDASGKTYDVAYSVNTTGATGLGAGTFYVQAVDWGDSKKITSVSEVSLPGGNDTWSTVVNNLSSNGCTGGANNVGCSIQSDSPIDQAKVDGSTYDWNYRVVFQTAGLDLDPAKVHIGAKFNLADGSRSGLIVSQTGAPTVPEPASLVLFGTGLVGIARAIRRRIS